MEKPEDQFRPLTPEEWKNLREHGIHPGDHWDGEMEQPVKRPSFMQSMLDRAGAFLPPEIRRAFEKRPIR